MLFFFTKMQQGERREEILQELFFLNHKMPLDFFSSLTLTVHLSLWVSHRDISLKMPKYFQRVLSQVPFGGV